LLREETKQTKLAWKAAYEDDSKVKKSTFKREPSPKERDT